MKKNYKAWIVLGIGAVTFVMYSVWHFPLGFISGICVGVSTTIIVKNNE